jgi:6-phosphofructokinase 1
MGKMAKNIMVAQSGGPTVAINASLAGVISGAKKYFPSAKIFGALNGIEGVLKGKIVSLDSQVDTDEKIMLLKQTPAMALGSCRYKMPSDESDPVYEKIDEIFLKYEIGVFIYIGGNDSMDTVLSLKKYFKDKNRGVSVLGVPKTIDNDLLCTDHTPGYGSAAKFIATTMSEIASDCFIYDLDAVTIVEIMGRNAGFLTMAAAIPTFLGEYAPQLVYLPERPVKTEKLVSDIKNALKKDRAVIVAVSEGVKTEDGEYLSAAMPDAFGHKQLSGASKVLEKIVKSEIGCKVRSIELNTPQRAAAHIASETDIEESFMLGERAVLAAAEGENGVVSVIKRISDEPYEIKIETEAVEGIANQEKKVPDEFINEEGNHVTEAAYRYMAPLIAGERKIVYKNSLPAKFKIDNTKLI